MFFYRVQLAKDSIVFISLATFTFKMHEIKWACTIDQKFGIVRSMRVYTSANFRMNKNLKICTIRTTP